MHRAGPSPTTPRPRPARGGTWGASTGRLVDRDPGLVEGKLDQRRAVRRQGRPDRRLEVGIALARAALCATRPSDRREIERPELAGDADAGAPTLLPHPDGPV